MWLAAMPSSSCLPTTLLQLVCSRLPQKTCHCPLCTLSTETHSLQLFLFYCSRIGLVVGTQGKPGLLLQGERTITQQLDQSGGSFFSYIIVMDCICPPKIHMLKPDLEYDSYLEVEALTGG